MIRLPLTHVHFTNKLTLIKIRIKPLNLSYKTSDNYVELRCERLFISHNSTLGYG